MGKLQIQSFTKFSIHDLGLYLKLVKYIWDASVYPVAKEDV